MPKKYRKKSQQVQKIAASRINFLFREAKNAFREEKNLSDKYVKMARKIAMKYKVKIPSKFKKSFCRNCYSFLLPGINCRVRIHKHRIIYYCLKCKHYMRQPLE